MKQLRWMKTKIGLFGDPKVMAMLSQRHGETYFVVWFLLKDIAGTVNCDGYACLSEQVPLTGEYIARVLRRRRDVVEKALDFLEQIDLIRRDEEGRIRLVDWEELQDFDKDERRRQQTRSRVARFRQKQGEGGGRTDGGTAEAPEKTAGGEAAAYYAQVFGGIHRAAQLALDEMECRWGVDAVCRAVAIAKERGAEGNNLNYIRSILANSGGQPRRRGKDDCHGYASIDEYVSVMLRQADEYESAVHTRAEGQPARRADGGTRRGAGRPSGPDL